MDQPKPHQGMHHIALNVTNFEECEFFYKTLLGMSEVWRPDPDNLYLSSGNDNLALHRAPKDFQASANQRLDHLGFFLSSKELVRNWHEFLDAHGVTIKAKPKDHRDGTSSFYCEDPDGNIVQMIYYPINT